jgi:hypothetical protein
MAMAMVMAVGDCFAIAAGRIATAQRLAISACL